MSSYDCSVVRSIQQWNDILLIICVPLVLRCWQSRAERYPKIIFVAVATASVNSDILKIEA